ncbi:MAG: hypothetical protein Q8L97_02000 [Nitrosomonas sp.]|uniref:hypothetical protein n=1 Tax=Nitrosomonas sp. TaxID=42353 RepID=UPI002730C225|nr:hypothetical protein [Nitrosomonas sp.]MDP1548921.1 hypothetical protein [Nitrosomonas sp.]
MPIQFFSTSSEVRVRQSFISPTVYLDHWAIRLFSDNLVLQDRFVNALRSKCGTLLLSSISFGEFAVPTDSRHAADAEDFIERLLPNIYLTDFALDKVLERERTEPNNAKRFWPSADLPQLKLFAERAQDALLGFTMRGFITLAHENRADIAAVTVEVIQQIKSGIEAARADSSYVAKARTIQPSDVRPRTLVILGELMRGFYLDPVAPISDNDVVDMLHAVMPINCCDYVLLDGAWAERVEKMKQRIMKVDSNMPIAKCFSKRNQGVQAFLSDLEAFDQSTLINPAIP